MSAAIGVQHTEVRWAMGNFFGISMYVMVISRTYLWYILGIYWVYHGHIFGILGYIMKIGFRMAVFLPTRNIGKNLGLF